MDTNQDVEKSERQASGDVFGLGAQIAENLCRHLSLDTLVLLRIYSRTRTQDLSIRKFITLTQNFSIELPRLRRAAVDAVIEDITIGHSFLDSIRRVDRADFKLLAQALTNAQSQKVTLDFLHAVQNYQPQQRPLALLYQDRLSRKLTRLAVKTLFIFNVLVFIILFLLPEFTAMYEEFGIELPPAMQLLATIAEFLYGRWFLILIFVLGISIWLRKNSEHLISTFTKKFNSWRWLQRPLTKTRRLKLSTDWVQALHLRHRQSDGKTALAAANVSKTEASTMKTAGTELTRFWLINRIVANSDDAATRWQRKIVYGFILIWNLLLAALVGLVAVAVVSVLTHIVKALAG